MASNENVIDDQPIEFVQSRIKKFEGKQDNVVDHQSRKHVHARIKAFEGIQVSAKQGAELPRGQNTTRAVAKEPERRNKVQGITKMTGKSGFPNTSANPKKTCKVSMPRPVHFIMPKDGKLEVNDEAIAMLKNIKDPVSVIAIIGKYRTGKSYIMNRIFNTNAGFALGGEVQSCTKGIWFWARPHPLDPERTLILLDTEGLGDVEQGDTTYDMKLFSLSLLLSNVLICNAVGALDDGVIKQLNLVTELTNHLKTRERDDEDLEEQYSSFFPTFVMLLRDFFLELKLDGKKCTPNAYLENALKLKKGKTRSINDYNLPRECIRDYFPRRMCHVLCKPIEDDIKLRNMEQVKESEIKDDFLKQSKKAVEEIIQAAKDPFIVELNAINGQRYIELVKIYVETMNAGGIPCISNTVELMRNNACHLALEAAVALFEETMIQETQGRLPMEEKDLIEKQKLARDVAFEHYRNEALFDDEGEKMQDLAKRLEDCYRIYHENNIQASNEKCKKILEECFRELRENVSAGKYSKKGGFKKYSEDRERGVKQYKETPGKGPMGESALQLWLDNAKMQEETIINADKAISEKDKEILKAAEESKREAQRAQEAEQRNERLKQDMIRQQKDQQDVIIKLQQDFQERQDKLEQEKDREVKEKEAEYRRYVEEGMTKQAEEHKALIESMRQDKELLAQQHEERMEQMKAQNQVHENLLRDLASQKEVNNELLRKMEELQEKANTPFWKFWKWNWK